MITFYMGTCSWCMAEKGHRFKKNSNELLGFQFLQISYPQNTFAWTILFSRMLCILTDKWVLRIPFASWNFFSIKTNFSGFFNCKKKKRNRKKTCQKGLYQHLGRKNYFDKQRASKNLFVAQNARHSYFLSTCDTLSHQSFDQKLLASVV